MSAPAEGENTNAFSDIQFRGDEERLEGTALNAQPPEACEAQSATVAISPASAVPGTPSQYSNTRISLYRDALRQQRKSWGGSFFQEYVFYACNTHELLSVFLQHPLHPITLAQRILVLLSCCTISLAYA